MDWPLALLLILGSLVVLMLSGMPIAFAFMLTCAMGAVVFWGGMEGLKALVVNLFSGVATFNLLPLPLFILMGTIIFDSGVGILMVDAVNKCLGRLPGRLSLVAVGAGTLLATLTGVSVGSIAILGKGLVPEMEKRGYQKPMTLGPIVGGGQLATMIPPSALAVFLGAIGQISIGELLIAIIVPGLLMASLFGAYIILRCMIQPSLAPSYDVSRVPLSEKFQATVRHVLPIGIIIFAVIGVILIGVATPSEAAALGVVACYILAAIHRKLNWQVVKKSALGAVETSIMILMIAAPAFTFSRMLAFTGAMSGLIKFASTLPVSPMALIIAMQLVVVFMGMFMGPFSIIMLTLPMYIPIVNALGFDLVWFGVIMLINVQMGLMTPPFGGDCYVMKSVVGAGVTVTDVFRSATPFILLTILAMAIIIVFPQVALWLPSVMA